MPSTFIKYRIAHTWDILSYSPYSSSIIGRKISFRLILHLLRLQIRGYNSMMHHMGSIYSIHRWHPIPLLAQFPSFPLFLIQFRRGPDKTHQSSKLNGKYSYNKSAFSGLAALACPLALLATGLPSLLLTSFRPYSSSTRLKSIGAAAEVAFTGVVFSDFHRVLGTGGRFMEFEVERAGFFVGRWVSGDGMVVGFELLDQSGRSRGVCPKSVFIAYPNLKRERDKGYRPVKN
jgi:hypothetical protein